MATLRKRGDKWQVQVRRRGFTPQTRSFSQRRDAERWAILKEREFDRLESLGLAGTKACDLTLAALLIRYQEKVSPLKRSGDREAYMVAALARAPFASSAAERITATELKAYRDKRLLTVRPSTVVRELGILQHAFEVARKEWGYEGLANPVKDVAKPKLPKGRTRRLRRGEEEQLIGGARLSRNRLLLPVMGIALETGMRLGEIVRAQWSECDIERRVLLLPTTKNDKPRTVPLTLRAVAIIDGQRGNQSIRIFPTTVEAIKRAWHRLTIRSEVSDLHFHDLRHEAVSRLFERGLELPEVMMISGHTDHRMLLRYTHLSASKLVEKLDRTDLASRAPRNLPAVE